ncbi:MAG: CHAT domain-containing protein [Burkholderiaceae bacterium]
MKIGIPVTHLLRVVAMATGLCSSVCVVADQAEAPRYAVSQGLALRAQGELSRSIEVLAQSVRSAATERDRMTATGELGASLLQARHLEQAAVSLRSAYQFFSGTEKARYALDLGNLASLGRRDNEAKSFYEEAMQLAGDDAELAVDAALNLARQAPKSELLRKLTELYPKISDVAEPATRARLYLNLGGQAHLLGKSALALSYQSYSQALHLSSTANDRRVHVEALDALAQLYEDADRRQEALALDRQGISSAQEQTSVALGDLVVNLEWRQARLYTALGRHDLALAAYQHAVDLVEPLRQDIPIEYDDGRSSFSRTLEPIYLGLFEGLLRAADGQSGEKRSATLRRARDAVELIKQAEMQDYLGDRCTVDAVKGGTATVIPAGTAVFYPVVLPDRIELLIETGSDITHFSTPVSGPLVRRTAGLFAKDLRDDAPAYLTRSRQLYNWLLRPLEGFLHDQRVTTLVVVPDDALRLIAIGALQDGEHFAIERYAVTTATGLSMTNTVAPVVQPMKILVAGISRPGPVVEKLSQETVDELLTPTFDRDTAIAGMVDSRTMFPPGPRFGRATEADTEKRDLALRAVLALPGVDQEVEAISRIGRSTSILNAPFTLDAFRREAETGSYRFIHIASHGLFGGSAAFSYILAYDDLLTLDGLQSLLGDDEFRKHPIELLSLSACETAEGDDRSPLGLSGAAIKARAKSVLGSLWPVEDSSARKTMEGFYGALATGGVSKAQALRQSQLALLRTKEYAHPFFWAPFVLIGNWL